MPDIMKERKSYTTKNRLVILDYLKENCSTTISAADIKKHLEEKEISVNTTTVYRLLDKLCAENIIIKYSDINSDKAVYQYAGEKGHCREHLHLKCIKCGKVMHLDCGFMDELYCQGFDKSPVNSLNAKYLSLENIYLKSFISHSRDC